MAIDIFQTSYCNKGHDMKTGRPINHECVVLPPEVLKAERDDRIDDALDIIDSKKPLRQHRGMKVKDT